LNYEKDRKILADVDGVLLDWESAFDAWMKQKGYTIAISTEYKQSIRYSLDQKLADQLVEQFNECAWIGYLKPLRDSVNALHILASKHWHIECITSLSKDHWAGELRRSNLKKWFGQIIRRCQCIETGGDKDAYLQEFKPGHWWIEDKPENCIAGLNAGHRPILIDHPYNQDFEHPDVVRVKNWQTIIELITE
jgi:FMN phosphatase YigB (HAD superfamily)|tara:strand:+ start:7047 stop:7625 length:579 start_codon:yes stop_codon:yes gene_type:complete